MGFMAGFGEAFSRSFGDARERSWRSQEAEKDQERALERTRVELDMRHAHDLRVRREEDERTQSRLIRSNIALGAIHGIPQEVAANLALEGIDFKNVDPSKLAVTTNSGSADFSVSAPSSLDAQTEATMGTPNVDTARQANSGAITRPTTGGGSVSSNGMRIGNHTVSVIAPQKSIDDRVDEVVTEVARLERDVARNVPGAAERLAEYERENVGPLRAAQARFSDRNDPTSETGLAIALARAESTGNTELASIYRSAQANIRTTKAIEAATAVPDSRLAQVTVNGVNVLTTVLPEQDMETGGYTYRDVQNGNALIEGEVRVLNEQESALMADVAKLSAEAPVREHMVKVQATAHGLRAFQRMSVLLSGPDAGAILNPLTRGAVGVVEGVAKELESGMGVFQAAMQNSDYSVDERTIADYEAKIDGLLSGGVLNTAQKIAAYRAVSTITAYRMGAMEGKDGRESTNADYQRFNDVINGARDVQTWNERMGAYFVDNMAGIQDSAILLNDYNTTVSQLKQRGITVNDIAPTVEGFIQQRNDPVLSQGFELAVSSGIVDQAMAQAQQRQQTEQTEIRSISSREEYDQLPSGTRYIDPTGQERTKR